MRPELEDLLRLLRLERLERDLFRGESRDIGSPQVFGGQVLGQALVAAHATLGGRRVHSLHAYFLRRGDVNAPIVYEVDRSRDGHSFSSRRVVAIQHGEQIFHMAASFQAEEQGLAHQIPAPEVPPPEALRDMRGLVEEQAAQLPPGALRLLRRETPFEFRPVQPVDLRSPGRQAPSQQIWFRLCERAPDDPDLHRCLLAYVSDYHLIGTALRPHGLSMGSPGLVLASIDHAMWFHADLRVDDWLLYAMDSPSASGMRGLARGSIYARDGRLVASTAQEGLMRVLPGAPGA
jgi:acyl-CoA thioesterase-2